MSTPLYPVAPRGELREGFVWIAIGAAIVIASWWMDRMTQHGAQIYTAPGLWPGLVGLAIALLGGFLAWRSVRRARHASWTAQEPDDTDYAPLAHFRLAAAFFFIYALLLVGHGLPFWIGTALFVTAYVFVFRRAERLAGARSGTPRGDVVLALTCGIATAVLVTLVFEQLFFVRLP